ncbi:hypothetical protein [Rubrivivax rivuli]|uniref:PEP-CTERM sorting domain-containing protein n=1 Tax=Rubrivivax rivuli TaxID=1862385 RepID=A0A437RS80_9BURK|nr:hypothetical protein [Rubrivivax rivuli]RVU49598.1 hypothetical protein EOE66_03300 [Rubrivivax rivuli]
MKFMRTLPLAWGLALGGLAAQAAPVIGAATDPVSGQSALTATGHDRFDTEFFADQAALADLLSGTGFAAGPLRAVGSEVEVRYVGTMAAHAGELFLQGSGALFSTRDGLSAADAAGDFSLTIDSISRSRTISGLSAFEALVFGMQAEAFAGDAGLGLAGNAAAQVLASGQGAVRARSVGTNTWLLGFETFGALDYADAVMWVRGVSFDSPPEPPPVQGVPLPGSLSLVLAGLGALALRPGRRRANR